nr:hypothetical protein [Tanacetum cinerariifolium]
MTLALVAKAFTLNNITPTNNNQRISSNPNNMQIAKSECQELGCSYAVQNPGIQIIKNMNGLSIVSEISNQYGNGNVVPAPIEDNYNGVDRNLIGCYNCRGEGHYAKNCTQASTSGTQSDKAPIYESDGSVKVHLSENCYDNDIFNMFTQEEQYTELLEPIPEPHSVQQNDSNVTYVVSNVEQGGGTVEQHPANVEKT